MQVRRRIRGFAAVPLLAVLVFAPAAEAKRDLYVTGANSDAVAAHEIAASGALSQIAGSPFAAGSTPVGVAATPDGRHLYVANLSGNNVSAYEIAASGALSQVAGSPFASGFGSNGVAATPDGRHLYVVNRGDGNVSAYAIAASGALAPVAGSPFAAGTNPTGVAATPDGRHLYVANRSGNNVSAYAIAASGALSQIAGSPFAAGSTPVGVAATPDGRHLYVANLNGDNVSAYEIAASGALTPVAGSPFAAGNGPTGVAATPDGRHLYVATSNDDNVSAYAIAASGALAPVAGSPFAAGVLSPDFQSLAITPDQPPVAAFTVSPADAGQASAFDASATTDPDGTPARFDWDFGDGTALADGGPTPTHTYATPGDYTATLTVTDDEGCSTERKYTGQTASCNGGAGARTTRTFTVSATPEPPPDGPLELVLSGPKTQPLEKAVEVEGMCSDECSLTGRGRVRIKPAGSGREARRRAGSYPLVKRTTSATALTERTLKIRVPKRTRRAATRAIENRRSRVRAQLKVKAKDAAGGVVTKPRTVKLKLR